MNQDSQSHRATPEQWERIKQLAKDDWEVQSVIYELCNRVEQLEAALLSLTSTVAKTGNDHKSRIKELELGQRVTDAYIVTAATLSPEERKELGVVTAPEFKAAMARAARQGAERAMVQIENGASWTPPDAISCAEFEAEFTSQYCNTWPDKEFEPPANCRQRLQRNGVPYPKSGCNACGMMSPKWRECDAALDRLAATESSPAGGGLVEEVRRVRTRARQVGLDEDRAAISAVAAWLKEQERRGLVDLPEALEEEANR